MKLFIHLGLHRTGTHTLRFHLWEKHPQINYLGRFQRDSGEKHLELTELISKLNNDDFDKRYNELLKKAGEIKLISNKINLISDECIWAYAFKDSKKDNKYNIQFEYSYFHHNNDSLLYDVFYKVPYSELVFNKQKTNFISNL